MGNISGVLRSMTKRPKWICELLTGHLKIVCSNDEKKQTKTKFARNPLPSH